MGPVVCPDCKKQLSMRSSTNGKGLTVVCKTCGWGVVVRFSAIKQMALDIRDMLKGKREEK